MALALKLAFQPWKWKKGVAIKELEEKFKKYLGVKYAFSFNSGRSSLFAILKALSLPENTDILLQAFTCNAVPNPVLWAKLNPIYIDCGNDFNIDIEDLKRKITSETKVLILQHTFGLPANMDEVNLIVRPRLAGSGPAQLADRNNEMIIIEDCAHALGAEYNNQKVGTLGKAAFFSFSRDKVISCVYGGIAVTNDDEIGKTLEELQKQFGMPGSIWIKQQIFHPLILHYIILPLYNFFDLGKMFLVASQWLHVLSKAVSWQEKRGQKPGYFPKALPNALAQMALNQFNKLDKFHSHRKEISKFYYEQLKDTGFGMPNMSEGQSFLRFAITHPKAHEIIYEAWHHQNMLLGDWYTTPIAPDDTQLEGMKYKSGMAPNAERLSKITLNLPTHINISLLEASRIVNFLKKWS